MAISWQNHCFSLAFIFREEVECSILEWCRFHLDIELFVSSKHQLSSLPQTRGRRKKKGCRGPGWPVPAHLWVIPPPLLLPVCCAFFLSPCGWEFTLEEKIDIRLWVLLKFQFYFSRFSLLFFVIVIISEEENLHSFIKKWLSNCNLTGFFFFYFLRGKM